MFLIDKLKGVFNRMIAPKTLENVLHITPMVSSEMKNAIELWEEMYKNKSPWLDKNTKSLGLAASIASEKARTATIEMEVKVTGEGERAEFIKECVKKLVPLVRKNLEYGIAFGSLIIKPYVTTGIDGKYTIKFTFTKATDFYPLSFDSEGNILECAFLDRIVTKEAVYTKVEYHQIQGTTLVVKNMAYKSEVINGQSNVLGVLSSTLGTPVSLTEVPAWAALSPETTVANIDTMLFGYFKMPQANCIDLDSPLGVSGYARAIDLIKDADKQYSNLLWEFEGGQLAVDVDRTVLLPTKDAQGRDLPPQLPELQDRLYRRNLDLGNDDLYNVFSPDLRDSNILNGLNAILMRIEDVCDLSRGTLSEASYAEARTATELRILKQRSYSANCDIQKELEHTLETVVSIIDKYCDLYNIVPSGEYEVGYSWDDSIIVDKDAERQVDLLDVDKGLLGKVEYRMKWMGETKKQAEEAIATINEEKTDTMLIQQSVMLQSAQQSTDNPNNNTNNDTNKQSSTSAQEENDKRKRANESTETTKTNNEES